MDKKSAKNMVKKLESMEEIFTDRDQDGIKSDVLGSYTGTGYSDLEPEQDPDDL